METESFTDWKHYLLETFFDTWEKNTQLNLTDYAFLIQRQFDLTKIELQITKQMAEAKEPGKCKRYHESHLSILIEIFIKALLEVSGDSDQITAKNIGLAKITMQENEQCIYNC